MNTAYNATAGHLAGIQRRVVRVMAVALLVFTSCKKSPSPPPTFREAQSLAGGIVLCLLVEHEPDEYASEVRRQAQESIPALAVAYRGCTSEQKESVRRFVRGFVDYEDSQYADLCRWYVQIERAIASKDLESRNQALQAEILTERTKAIVASLPPREKQLAQYQMKGMEDLPGLLQSKIPRSSPLDSFDVGAGKEAAAKFDFARKQSYAKTYRRITQEELSK